MNYELFKYNMMVSRYVYHIASEDRWLVCNTTNLPEDAKTLMQEYSGKVEYLIPLKGPDYPNLKDHTPEQAMHEFDHLLFHYKRKASAVAKAREFWGFPRYR